MCLKTDAILLENTFYQFQYFTTKFLCMVEIYQEMFQSCSFNRNDVMVLFKWAWSRLINKLSLISLKVLVSEARISKWSKSFEQVHSSRCSDTSDCLTLLRGSPDKLDIPICSAALVKRWGGGGGGGFFYQKK